MIFKGVVSKDDVQDYVDGVNGVDGVDHGEGSKSDDEGVGRVVVDDGGTPWLDNQLKISMCENCQTIEEEKKTTAAPLSHFSTNCRKASATDST